MCIYCSIYLLFKTKTFWHNYFPDDFANTCSVCTAQKIKFFIKDFFSKCNQIRRKLTH